MSQFHGSSCCLWLIYYCADLCWLLWTQVHGSVVRAVDSRSAGPWFNSGWRSWFTFMTWSSNQIIQMINIMSPITTSIRTITRMSARMVAEHYDGTALVRITVFCSAIVIDVIVHCHTAGALLSQNGRKQLSLSSCGWVLILSGQFIITLVAELGIQPLIRSFWTETSAITFSTFPIAVTIFPSSTYGGDLSLSVDGACIIALSAQYTRL